MGWFQFSVKIGNANYSILLFIRQEKRFPNCQTGWWHPDSRWKCSKWSPAWQCLYVTRGKLNPRTEWFFIQWETSPCLGEGICHTPLSPPARPGTRGTSPAWRAEEGRLPYEASSLVSPLCISFKTQGKRLIWRQFHLASCLVQQGKGADRANWYINESHPHYPRDWRTASASGQQADAEGSRPPVQNLGDHNIGKFFHPVSKAGRARGSCSWFLHRSFRTFSNRSNKYTLFSGSFLVREQPWWQFWAQNSLPFSKLLLLLAED